MAMSVHAHAGVYRRQIGDFVWFYFRVKWPANRISREHGGLSGSASSSSRVRLGLTRH